MANSVFQAFEILKADLEITDLQSETVSTRQQTVRDVVQAGLSTEDSFLAGSYRRNTMIAPLSEADNGYYNASVHYNGVTEINLPGYSIGGGDVLLTNIDFQVGPLGSRR